jgi:hypothetical protein
LLVIGAPTRRGGALSVDGRAGVAAVAILLSMDLNSAAAWAGIVSAGAAVVALVPLFIKSRSKPNSPEASKHHGVRRCPQCKGKGYIQFSTAATGPCRVCLGTGQIEVSGANADEVAKVIRTIQNKPVDEANAAED